MDKIDYKKVFKECYGATAAPALVDVAPMQFLMVDGQGDPERTPRFQQGIEALFSLAYTIKSLVKKGPMGLDFTVMPLEGLWWADDMAHFRDHRDAWQWTLMIMQPPVVSATTLDEAFAALRAKKGAPPAFTEVRLARFNEGKAVQSLHVGPFAEEGPAIERLHRWASERGYGLHGKHHEIYLSDMRRTAPGKRKTILRQPVVRSG